MVKAVISSSFLINGKSGSGVGSSFLINAKQGMSALSRLQIIKEAVTVINLSRYSARAKQGIKQLSNARAFTLAGRRIFARNVATDVLTDLGFIPEGSTTLTDVALADGFYEFEVRTSNDFWQDTRSRVRFTAQITAGVIEFQQVPNIENLRFVITQGFQTSLRWNVPDTVFIPGLKFGIWRSASTPVVVTGPPDEIVTAHDGVGAYRKTLTQTAPEYFAVAAYTPTDQGAESEIFSTWSSVPLGSPPDQSI